MRHLPEKQMGLLDIAWLIYILGNLFFTTMTKTKRCRTKCADGTKQAMKIFEYNVLVEDIPEKGLSKEFEDMPGLLAGIDDGSAAGPVKGSFKLKKLEGGLHLSGRIDGDIELKCDRCLETFPLPVHVDFSYILMSKLADHVRDMIELKGNDMDVSFFDGVGIDVGHYFREQVLLQFPMKRLCDIACKGLCLGCGADLNKQKCSCPEPAVESPFSILQQLLKTSST